MSREFTELTLRMDDAVLAFVERADELNLPAVNPCAEMFPYDDVWDILPQPNCVCSMRGPLPPIEPMWVGGMRPTGA